MGLLISSIKFKNTYLLNENLPGKAENLEKTSLYMMIELIEFSVVVQRLLNVPIYFYFGVGVMIKFV